MGARSSRRASVDASGRGERWESSEGESMGKRSRDLFGGGDMMGRLRKVQEQITQAQAELEGEMVEGSAGGGAVKVVMSGGMECKSVQIAPHLIEEGDPEMLQDLVRVAVNLAIQDAKFLAAQKLGPLTGAMSLGGGSE
jgi:DNA-binding YbaB/EbfC family protein